MQTASQIMAAKKQAKAAVKMGRKGQGSELNPGYFLDSVQYLKAAEQEVQMPSLFDFMEAPAA